MKKVILGLMLLFFHVFHGKCQSMELRMLKKITDFFEEAISTTYQSPDSSYYWFLSDFIKEQEDGNTTMIIANIDRNRLNNIIGDIRKKGMSSFFYGKRNMKDFQNTKAMPDSIFERFKINYKYNIVRLSDIYLKYYLSGNDSELAQYVKQQHESLIEISILSFSLYLKPRFNELVCRKNKELMALIFLPYLCYNTGIGFNPNQQTN